MSSQRFKDRQQCLNRYDHTSTKKKKKKFRKEQKNEGMEENKEMKHQLCHSSLENIQFGNIAYTVLKEMSF